MTSRSLALASAVLAASAALAAPGCGETQRAPEGPKLPAVREYLAKTHGWPGKTKKAAVGRQLVKRLPNGLTVVLREKHAVPVATVQLWVRTGAMDEAEFLGAGVSHYVEHMLFKGTQKRKVREFDRAVMAAGGRLNAYTSHARTVYHVTLPAEGFDLALDGLADFAQRATFPEEECARERKVILEEIHRAQDNPDRAFWQLMNRTLYPGHPYRHPVLGYEEAFRRLTRADLVTYYRRRYIPRNIALVAVGDFDAAEKLKRVREAFANFAPGLAAEPARPDAPVRNASREVVAHDPRIKEARVAIAWPSFSIHHEDLYALDLAAQVLGQGRASRLGRRLLGGERALARSVTSWNHTPTFRGTFAVHVRCDEKDVPAVRAAVLEEVERLKRRPPSREELARAQRKVVARTVYERETVGGLAGSLGSDLFTTGDLDFSEKYAAGLRRTSAREVAAAARAWLLPERRTTVVLLPGEPPAKAVAGDTPARASAPKPVVTKLAGGARLVVLEDPSVPAVAVTAAFLGGLRFEPEGKEGVGDFMAAMLKRGTKKRDATRIAAAVEDLGARLSCEGGRNSFLVKAKALSEDLPALVDLAAEVLTEPAFDAGEFEKARKHRLVALAAAEERPGQLAGIAIRELAFRGHPYARRTIGTRESLEKMTPADLDNFHARFAVPGNLVVAVVGDVTPARARAEIERAFGRLLAREGAFRPPAVPAMPRIEKTRTEVVTKPGLNQAVFRIAWRGPAMADADRYALQVLSAVLGGMGSRLFDEVREKRGLAYDIGCYAWPQLDKGAFFVYGGVLPEKAGEAIGLCLAEVRKVAGEGVTSEELARARARILGGRVTGLQALSARATRVALDERYGLGADALWRGEEKYRAVTREDVQRVARKYLAAPHALAIVGPEEKKALLEAAAVAE